MGLEMPEKPSRSLPQDEEAVTEALNSLSLDELQTREQVQVLDTISELRKLGLDSDVSIPQIVVCGDQSSGKSSLIEALTEISLPRGENLCTRFATQITMRRTEKKSVTVRIIGNVKRPASELEKLKAFKETLSDFSQVPGLIERAKKCMGIDENGNAFSLDILNIEITGPTQPQLSVFDIPGLIHTATKGVTEEDVKKVSYMTDYFIQQPRTICIAVVSASNDISNQIILSKVRKHDPKGDRTIGVITKPDRLSPGSQSEAAYLELAENKNIYLKLGWHLIKNSSFEEQNHSLDQRNTSERVFFSKSNFQKLGQSNLGIDALRDRLSSLLFEHVQRELPQLRSEVESKLSKTLKSLEVLGDARTTATDCKRHLVKLFTTCQSISGAAVRGYYDDPFFANDASQAGRGRDGTLTKRLRATVEKTNNAFADKLNTVGHRYDLSSYLADKETIENMPGQWRDTQNSIFSTPQRLSEKEAYEWVYRAIEHTRGNELPCALNIRTISHLLGEQSSKWIAIATMYVNDISDSCRAFLEELLKCTCSHDIKGRLDMISQAFEKRFREAFKELQRIEEDIRAFPSTYDAEYMHRVNARRKARLEPDQPRPTSSRNSSYSATAGDANQVEDLLDSLDAIYHVQLKLFIANATTQIVERHILRGLEEVFSPILVMEMCDADALRMAAEAPQQVRQRQYLQTLVQKFSSARDVLLKLSYT